MAIAVLDESQLQDLIRQAVLLATAELRDELERSRTPELMDKAALCKYLAPCHPSSINRFMKKGMPFEKCGSEPRFRKCCVDAWLKGVVCSKCQSLSDTTQSELSPDRKTTIAEPGTCTSASPAV